MSENGIHQPADRIGATSWVGTVPDLSHLRVLEVGTAVAIPLVSTMLAALGAEVLKVESAAKPDGNRVRLAKDPANEPPGEEFPYYQEISAGKKSILLNLKSPQGKDIFAELLRKSDVFVQNWAPGWLDRLGFSSERIFELNPKLIMCFACGYGQWGPKKDARVYASVMSALAGLESLVGSETGETCGIIGVHLADFNAAYQSLSWILAALVRRDRTGFGGLLDISQVEALVTTLGEPIVEMQMAGTLPGPRGNRDARYCPRNAFPVAGDDRWVTITVTDDEAWARLLVVIAETDSKLAAMLAESEWAKTDGRIADRERIEAMLGDWTIKWEEFALAARLQEARIACAPVTVATQVAHDPHMLARTATTFHANHLGRQFESTSAPWLINGQPMPTRAAAPTLGGETHEVLTDLLGMSAEEIAELSREGVLA